MRNIIYKIIQKHDHESGRITTTAGEITNVVKRFILWKDFGSHPFTCFSDFIDGKLTHYYTDEISVRWSIDELFEYWYLSVDLNKPLTEPLKM